jgi:hypothetical protein
MSGPERSVERLLRRLVALLDSAGEPAWRTTLQNLLLEAEAAQGDDGRYQHLLRRILGLYTTGMGGFVDVVLQANGHVLPEQNEFEMVRRRLFDVALERLR